MASLKTLKLKRIFVWTTYNNLRNTPPKEIETMEEIKATANDILPALEEHVGEYLKMTKEAEALAAKVRAKELKVEEQNVKVEEINKKFVAYNQEKGTEVVEIKLHKDTMAILVKQFEKWGKNWVSNIAEFVELDKAFTEANK